MLIAGLLWAVAAAQLDTSVGVSGSTQRVHNIGLIQARNTQVTLGAVCALIGAVLFGFGATRRAPLQPSTPLRVHDAEERVPCPYCAERILPAARVCRYCGRDVVPAGTPVAERAEPAIDWPKGTCPNCMALIRKDAESCPRCKALFGPGSTWKIGELS